MEQPSVARAIVTLSRHQASLERHRAGVRKMLAKVAVATRALLIAGSLTGAGLSSSVAAAPVAQATPTVEVTCATPPLTEAALREVLAQPPGMVYAGTQGTPVVFPTPPPGGNPASAATIAAITARAEQLLTCGNAGDGARYFGNFSPAYLNAFLGGFLGEAPTDADIEQATAGLATVMPPTGRVTLIAIEDVRELPDGRVAATIRLDSGSSRSVFVRVGDDWLVDAVTPLPAATPAP